MHMQTIYFTPIFAMFVTFYFQPLDKKSEEYARLLKYVKNTHGKTHTMYELEVEDVCMIKMNKINSLLLSVILAGRVSTTGSVYSLVFRGSGLSSRVWLPFFH